jgi:hypothetical protein
LSGNEIDATYRCKVLANALERPADHPTKNRICGEVRESARQAFPVSVRQ